MMLVKHANKKHKPIEEDNEILSSISDPNPWTPEREAEWLKQPAKAIQRRFPPIRKPPHVSRQGKRHG